MAVTLPTPKVIPATPETTFDELWVDSIRIDSPINGEGITVNFHYRASRTVNAQTGEKAGDPDGSQQVAFAIKWQEMTADQIALMYNLVSMLREKLQ